MTNDHKTLLHAENMCKSFYYPNTVPILKGIELTISSGTSTAIMGRSGEGKSTLLQILGTLDTPCSGRLDIAGQTVSSSNRNAIRNRHLAFIFQSFFLLEDYTALENVLMPASIARQPIGKHSAAFERGMALLDKVGLAHRAHFRTKMLSGGEKQRVAIARAFCNDPDLILADEPTGNLDKASADAIHSLLLEFPKNTNKALVVVTHSQELADLCDTVYHLVDGLLVLCNNKRNI